MARDRELFFTFSDVGSATNVSAVDKDITLTPFRGGLVTLTSTANQWAVGYSDSMNFTHFRNQIADTSNLTTETVTSAILGDPILPNSTALSEYYLRAAVAPIGFVGPEACQFIVQAAFDSGSGTAPTANTAYTQVSSVGICPATATAQTVSATAASPAVFTPSVGVVPASGSIIMFTALGSAGTGIAVRTPYVVLQTAATTYQLVTTLGGTTAVAISTTAMTNGTALVGQNATNLTPIGLVDASDRIQFSQPVAVGDTIIMGAAGSVTGLTAGTLYYVTGVFSDGVTLSTSSGGSTVAIGGSVTNAFFGKVDFNTLNAIFPSAGTGNVITTAVPHGLTVGELIVPSATVVNGLTTGLGYYVLSTPSQTTFTVSATLGGAIQTVSATPAALFVGRPPKIVNVQVGLTTRPWIRAAVQQLNGSAAQDGYIAIYNADISVGRDSAQVA